MSEKKDSGGLYTAGYHGTSVQQAMRIVESGFEPTAGGVVFVPMDDMWQAAHRAVTESTGELEFALVAATFPKTPLTYNKDFNPEITIPPELVNQIYIVRVIAWQMRRNSGIPPRLLYPAEPSELLR
ncbi:MAG: hypothetical protein WBP12_00825 [Candidatus Saccharimonas sp.]